MSKRLKPRLRDVALAAEVSLGTASNVFYRPEKVRPELRERVQAAAARLGYSGPDPTARLMRAGKVNAIGIVAPAHFSVTDCLRNSSFRMFMQGVAEVCDAEGANLVIIPDPATSGSIHSVLVDGLIFGQVEHLAVIEPARLRRLPFAVVDFDAGPEINSVRVDAREGARLAARHLLGLGHRRFAILSFLRDFRPARYYPPAEGRPDTIAGMPIDQEKLRGYADALSEQGLAMSDVPVVQAHPWDDAAAAMLLDHAPDATAFLSMSAMQGIELLKEARRRNIDVPGQMSVVGFNDIPEASTCVPPLTLVDSRNTEKGRIAARMVFSDGQPRNELLPPALILRATTARPPTADGRNARAATVPSCEDDV